MIRARAAIIGLIAASAQAAATPVLETASRAGLEAPEPVVYAQVCLRNRQLPRAIEVWTRWGVGDAWRRTAARNGVEVLYRLATDAPEDGLALTVRYRDGAVYRERPAYAGWSNEPIDDCGLLPRWEFQETVDESGQTVIELVATVSP